MAALRFHQLLEVGTGFNYQPPAEAAVHPNSAAIIAEINAQTKLAKPTINTTHWSAGLDLVPTNQPLVSVECTRTESWATTRREILADGVPIPKGYTPQVDSDHQGVFYMPDDTIAGPDGTIYTGSVWEVPDLVPTLTGWKASGVARFRGVRSIKHTDGSVTAHPSVSIGRYNTWRDATYPHLPTDSLKRKLFEGPECICTASGLSLLGGMITEEDINLGHIFHGLGISTPKSNGFQAPAVSGDGRVAGSLIKQGMAFVLPADAPMPAHPVARMIAECAQRYAIWFWDTAGAVSFRAQPGINLFGAQPSTILSDFPWTSGHILG